ncbi:MAG: NifU family protein [Acidimicrobiia bacterium]|nr:NifU family protein [Acidimicrobiia bacterium]MDH4309133.1 NifU family protein [Acidimicrobiia bacterium]
MSEETVFSVSDEAREMILRLREDEPGDEEFGLLIEVTGFRGRQFNYELSFMALSAAGGDHVVERHGDLPIVYPSGDVDKLRGASLALTDQGLAMNNPNVPESPAMAEPMGELTGPLAEQVETVLSQQVNPAIASHGGGAELVGVEGSTAYLRLMGGCQGCGMAQVTLKQGIERILLEAIPELTSVVDVTDHASGSDPYYQAAKK